MMLGRERTPPTNFGIAPAVIQPALRRLAPRKASVNPGRLVLRRRAPKPSLDMSQELGFAKLIPALSTTSLRALTENGYFMFSFREQSLHGSRIILE